MISDEYCKNRIWSKYHVTDIHYVLWKRIFLSDPQLFRMIEGVIFYHASYDMEILTFNPEYSKLWECLLKDYGYPHVALREMGYDENLHCYCVDVHSPILLNFIRNIQRMWSENPRSKERWIQKYGEEDIENNKNNKNKQSRIWL